MASHDKKGKKRKKKKSSAEALPQEPQEKHVLYLPQREPGERFPELQIVAKDIRLIDARLFSTAVANSSAIQWREFLRMQLPSEKISRRVYNLGTGPNVEVTVAKPQGKSTWMLYRSYTRADEMTMLDYKETKLFYLQFMPQSLLNGDTELSLQYITDWLSIAFIMRNELERRRLSTEAFGRGCRLTVTDMSIAPLHHTHRKSFAKEQLKNFKIWPQMVAESAQDIVKSVKHRILFIENVIRFGGMPNIMREFTKENQDWVNERLKLSNIYKQIVLGKNRIEELNKMRPFNSVYHLASELHELPPSLGHAVFFCRALKDFTLIVEKEEIARKVSKNGESIPLLVRPTRYEYKPNAVTAYKESSDLVEPLPLNFHEPPRRAPSVNSLSGFSSESGASTATESPGDWQHNWKMQTMHRDMEHRLMDSSIQNPLEEQQLGELEASQRIADEVDRRIALLNENQRMEAIFGGKSSELLRYYQLLYDKPLKLCRDRNIRQLLIGQANKLLDFMEESESGGNILDMQLTDYLFNEIIRMAPECNKDPYDGLGINNAWKILIDSNVLKKKSRQTLKTVFSSRHSWVNVNFLSQQCTVSRCDQLQNDIMTPAEFSSVSITWLVLCAVICTICTTLLGFLIKSH